LRLPESNAEQTAVLRRHLSIRGIRQAGRHDVLMQIKVLWQLGGQRIFIHGNNVLKPEAVSHFCSKLQCFRNLSFIDTVEKMAVMEEKA
jgi:hypothetical protein